MPAYLPFFPPDLDISKQESQEAALWMHCGHRHLIALMEAHDKVAHGHSLKHVIEAMTGVYDADNCDKVHEFLDWAEEMVERGKVAIYN